MRIENKSAVSLPLSRSARVAYFTSENNPSASSCKVFTLGRKTAYTLPPRCGHLVGEVQEGGGAVEPHPSAGWDESRLRTCSRCRRSLPPSEFYHRVGHKPDHYCKSCRVEDSRQRYRRKAHARWVEAEARHTLVEVADREERIRLIRQALQVVRRSVEARSRKRRMAEYLAEH